MNANRKWIVLLFALCATLPLLAVRAEAQRPDWRAKREYIGRYRRVKPGRDGEVRLVLNIMGRNNDADEIVSRPGGRDIELTGHWDVRGGLLHVDLRRPNGEREPERVFRLDGRNLINVDDPHAFYKKQ
jgi:hypothetical protein